MAVYLPYVISVFLILPLISTAQMNKNVTLGSSLTAGEPSSAWLSPSKDFAFGFQEIQPGFFLLAIWFNQIPEKTITWSANRDHLAPSGSKVKLTSDRGLVLSDPSGQEMWKTLLSGGRLAYAALLDSGNLVLATRASAVLWQSFEDPTDTMLPIQTLNLGDQLIARYSEQNYSSGRFTFKLQASGNLALFTTNFPIFNSTDSFYWAYEGLGSQVVFNNSGLMYLVAKNGSILTDIFSEGQVSEQVRYQRVILEHDGVLRNYVYPTKSSNTTGWSLKSFAPDNICTAVIQQTGSGVCGYNSYCQFGNDSRPHCLCPPGYTLLDPSYEMGGCVQNFLPQSCEEPSQEQSHFDLKSLKDVDWPLSDYEHFQNVSIDWCRQVCLNDCFCAVGIFRDGGDCWKKKLPLSNGKSDTSVDRTAFIKVRISGGLRERNNKRSIKVLSALLGTSGLCNIILLFIIVIGICLFARRDKLLPGTSRNTMARGDYSVRGFSYKELTEATSGFKEELGRGAFGVVFKGVIGEIFGAQTLIAVKKLDSLSQDADKEFKAEVNAIGHTHHKNLVRLIGFCDEGEHRLLVYEYMRNGTLSDFICGTDKPSWEIRLRIIQGIARGLFYLHEECNNQIIHCDIKPQNILLDGDYNARISDFGLAKLLRLDQTQTNTAARGTRGYVAPEWFRNMPITAKVDVYSFGILLLEIINCRKNVDIQGRDTEEECPVLLTDWAYDCYQMKTIDDLVDDDMEALRDKPKLEQFVKIAIWCIQDDPNLRPTMRMVVQMLEGLVQVPEPPNPTSYSSSLAT